MPNTSKTPQRSCCACSSKQHKRALVRFVRTPQGTVVLDRTGRAAGRGAYVCARAECFYRARRQHRLDRALRCSLDDADYGRLEHEFMLLVGANQTGTTNSVGAHRASAGE